jgi:hypothetical protein
MKWVCGIHSRNEIRMETSYNKTSWDTMTQTEDITKTGDQVQQEGTGS